MSVIYSPVFNIDIIYKQLFINTLILGIKINMELLNMSTNILLLITTAISLLLLSFNNTVISKKTVSVVIPAFNEEKTIKHVIDTVLQVDAIKQVIVVDDGSTDNTYDIVSKIENVKLLKHKTNKGKGSAMSTGLKEALEDIVLFLDADLSQINKKQVEAIINPIINGEADITKTKFKREAGRVTELTAKPLLQFFFPELSFEQPLSGQFAAVKAFFDKIDLENDYGVDIGIVLDADALGMRIVEVDIGNIVHEMSTLEELNLMANEVVRTIVDRAISYGRFTMVDDLGNAILMEIMGLSLITFGLFGLFFIKFVTSILSAIIIGLGLIISIYYILRIVRMSIRIYRQSKISPMQMLKSFIHMHFPVIISIFIIIAIVITLLGSVSITPHEISIEPASKNIVISTNNDTGGLDVRGPYTVEKALENEEHLIRLPNSAINTIQAQYGDNIYIDGDVYQLEQSVNYENDLIRMPQDARGYLKLEPGTVIRDSNLKGLFENMYIVRNMEPEEYVDNGSANDTNSSNLNFSNVNVSVAKEYTTQNLPEKVLNVYVNDTLVGKTSGFITDSTYNVYVNGVFVKSLNLNTSSEGIIYNDTYLSSNITVMLNNTDSNTTMKFADINSPNKFVNLYITNTNSSIS